MITRDRYVLGVLDGGVELGPPAGGLQQVAAEMAGK